MLMQVVEIKKEIKRIGQRVETDGGFQLSCLATEEEFQNLKRQLQSVETQAVKMK